VKVAQCIAALCRAGMARLGAVKQPVQRVIN